MKFKFGDWVVYNPGYKTIIGRVTTCNDVSAYVCFHTGCTSNRTRIEDLRLATNDEIKVAPKNIGHHRFDDECPNLDDACFGLACKSVKRFQAW